MSFLNKIKGHLFEEEPGEVAQAAPAQPAGAPAAAVPIMGGTSVVARAAVDPDMFDTIRNNTYQRTSALTTLIEAAGKLEKVIPDLPTRLKAAHTMAGAGRGAKEISEAVAIHLSDVDNQERQFERALEGKVQAEAGSLRAQAQAAASSSKAASEEIARLQSRITELHTQVAEQTQAASRLEAEAAQTESSLRLKNEQFKAAAQAVRNELNGHKAAILSTLA